MDWQDQLREIIKDAEGMRKPKKAQRPKAIPMQLNVEITVQEYQAQQVELWGQHFLVIMPKGGKPRIVPAK